MSHRCTLVMAAMIATHNARLPESPPNLECIWERMIVPGSLSQRKNYGRTEFRADRPLTGSN